MKRMLDAINIMLQTIGEQPLESDTELSASFEGTTALSVLDEVKLDVLSEGLECNTDTEWPFCPDTNGYIPIPLNAIRVDPTSPMYNYIVKSHLLYDKKGKSYKFTLPVLCDVVWDLNFDDLPHTVQYYITIKAARRFQARVIGDTTQYSFSEKDEMEALLQLRREEADQGDYNVFNNYSVMRVINRGFNPSSSGGY